MNSDISCLGLLRLKLKANDKLGSECWVFDVLYFIILNQNHHKLYVG